MSEQYKEENLGEKKSERRSSWLDKHQASQRGDVIYVLRTAQQHHVMLGMIADQKANIVLGAFLIFITVTQSMLEKDSQYSISMWILSAFFTAAAIFALLVITPRFRNPKPASGKLSNLLFFGSFSALSQDEYLHALKDSLQNNDQAHTLIINDIYQIGKVLDKKYVNLRLSYMSLGTGIISSAIAFSIIRLSQL